jgi:hypothetical protein
LKLLSHLPVVRPATTADDDSWRAHASTHHVYHLSTILIHVMVVVQTSHTTPSSFLDVLPRFVALSKLHCYFEGDQQEIKIYNNGYEGNRKKSIKPSLKIVDSHFCTQISLQYC